MENKLFNSVFETQLRLLLLLNAGKRNWYSLGRLVLLDFIICSKYVFGLLHSMSHAFIRTAGEISGLSGNSLTEIIIVETASIFMYAQTTQAVPLGALSGMAENNYAQFLNKVHTETRNCVFDPICTERDDTSCSACLIIPEISCNHFNNELGRKYLYTIDTLENPLVGFWEM